MERKQNKKNKQQSEAMGSDYVDAQERIIVLRGEMERLLSRVESRSCGKKEAMRCIRDVDTLNVEYQTLIRTWFPQTYNLLHFSGKFPFSTR